MDRKTVIYIVEYLALGIMALSVGIYLYLDNHDAAWPWVMLFVFATWVHGIFWGYLFALRGRLTWF